MKKDKKNKKEIILEGQLVVPFGVKNKNNRIYTKDSFNKAIEDYNKKIEEKRAFGELTEYEDLDHPEKFRDDYSTVYLGGVSHFIENIEIKDDGLYADIRLIDTIKGRMVMEVIKDEKFPFVVRPRGMGNVDENGCVTINKIIAFDLIPKDKDIFKMDNDERN